MLVISAWEVLLAAIALLVAGYGLGLLLQRQNTGNSDDEEKKSGKQQKDADVSL